jgi:hypothetical protein
MRLIKVLFMLIFIVLLIYNISFAVQIVCIDNGTFRRGINNVGDIVEIQEDNVELTGAGYNNFNKIIVRGLTKTEIMVPINSIRLETMTDPNNFDIEYWLDTNTGEWNRIVNKPKYRLNTIDLTEQDINDLNSDIVNNETKLNILRKIKDTIILDPNNIGILRARSTILNNGF